MIIEVQKLPTLKEKLNYIATNYKAVFSTDDGKGPGCKNAVLNAAALLGANMKTFRAAIDVNDNHPTVIPPAVTWEQLPAQHSPESMWLIQITTPPPINPSYHHVMILFTDATDFYLYQAFRDDNDQLESHIDIYPCVTQISDYTAWKASVAFFALQKAWGPQARTAFWMLCNIDLKTTSLTAAQLNMTMSEGDAIAPSIFCMPIPIKNKK